MSVETKELNPRESFYQIEYLFALQQNKSTLLLAFL